MPKSYYNYSKILSFNAVYNLIIGNRGKGKTFGAKKKCIKDGITKGHQTIYLRRYREEKDIAKSTFFDDIREFFPGFHFRIHGNTGQWSDAIDEGMKNREWHTIVIFVALSQAQNYKSANFPNVKTIIYDEFIKEDNNSNYIKNEAKAFNNFYSTVDRWKDKTRVFMLANSVSAMNPFFLEWNIVPSNDENDEFIIKKRGFIVCHIDNNEDFNKEVYQTRFGQFIQDSEYGDYAVENKFADNHEKMLEEKNSKARYLFSLECTNGTFSVWYDIADNHYYIQEKLPKDQNVFTMISSRMDNDKQLLTFSDKPLGNLRTAFRRGRMSFDNQVTRNTFMEIFKR